MTAMVSLKWKNDLFDNHIGGVVAVNGKIYGSNWTGNAGGNWMCVDWDTGETNYEAHWMNKGRLLRQTIGFTVMRKKRVIWLW
jgi:hypothetical protein